VTNGTTVCKQPWKELMKRICGLNNLFSLTFPWLGHWQRLNRGLKEIIEGIYYMCLLWANFSLKRTHSGRWSCSFNLKAHTLDGNNSLKFYSKCSLLWLCLNINFQCDTKNNKMQFIRKILFYFHMSNLYNLNILISNPLSVQNFQLYTM